MTDQERALFVRKSLRYAEASNTAVKAKNPKARQVEIDTQLTSEAAANSLAAAYLAANVGPRVMKSEFEGLLTLSSFTGGPPSYTPNFPAYNLTSGQVTVVRATIDFNTGLTDIEVRG